MDGWMDESENNFCQYHLFRKLLVLIFSRGKKMFLPLILKDYISDKGRQIS